MTRRPSHRACALALTAVLVSCEGAYLTAPPNSTIGVSANPEFVAAHGGVSEITAFVIEPAGTYVSDGTVVRWTTNLGTIDAETRTRRGVAQARFVSDSRSGTAHIRAFSGGVMTDPIEIRVGNIRIPPRGIRLRAVPSRITISNSTHVIATVVDEFGNPVANVAVFFEVADANKDTEFFDSAGAPIYTDNNGEAEDVLRTRRNTQGFVLVRAVVFGPNGPILSDDLRIEIL